MKVTYDLHEFYRVVGIVRDLDYLQQLGLTTEWMFGFWPSEMEDVLDFCASHPQFHVVSYLGKGIFINRYDERGLGFKLAEGYADPDYMLNMQAAHRWMFPQLYRD